jgi:hypothetical protein
MVQGAQVNPLDPVSVPPCGRARTAARRAGRGTSRPGAGGRPRGARPPARWRRLARARTAAGVTPAALPLAAPTRRDSRYEPVRGGACGVWRVACGVGRVACGAWRVACGAWRVACGGAARVQRHPTPCRRAARARRSATRLEQQPQATVRQAPSWPSRWANFSLF